MIESTSTISRGAFENISLDFFLSRWMDRARIFVGQRTFAANQRRSLLGMAYLIRPPSLWFLLALTNIRFIALDFAEAAVFVSIRTAPKTLRSEKKEE